MVTLADKIQHLYPNAKSLIDYEVHTNASESIIHAWNADVLGPQPTQEALDAVSSAVETKQLLSKLSDIRWRKESAGITVGTQPVSTLREEMAIWQGMLLEMTFRPGVTTSFEYKPRNGVNVTLTATQVQRIYACFAWYVATCFGTERYLASQIGTLTNEQILALAETESTWPQRAFTWEVPE